jgi:hypothetical protein
MSLIGSALGGWLRLKGLRRASLLWLLRRVALRRCVVVFMNDFLGRGVKVSASVSSANSYVRTYTVYVMCM